jgi:hypothetical protein
VQIGFHRSALSALPDFVISPRFAEEVFAGGLGDQAELFEFEVGALDFAFVDGEFLGERGGRGRDSPEVRVLLRI